MVRLSGPWQTVLVSSRANVEDRFTKREIVKDNIISVDWHMPLSHVPEMFAISIGKSRYSLELIRKSKVFVINYMPYHSQKEVLYCGTNSGEHIDKFEKAGLMKEEADSVDCARVREAIAYYECEVTHEVEVGDHILFIGHVTGSDIKEKGKRLFHLGKHAFTTTKEIEEEKNG